MSSISNISNTSITTERKNESKRSQRSLLSNRDYQVFVKTLENHVVTVLVSANTTAEQLAMEVFKSKFADQAQAEGWNLYKREDWNTYKKSVRFIYAGRQWEPNCSFSQSNITPGSTLLEALRLRGGAMPPIAFNDLSSQQLVDFDPLAPDWRTVYIGLNLLGICPTRECAAYNAEVWIKVGLSGTKFFNIAREAVRAQCPQCHKPAKEVTNMGFHECHFLIEGRKEGESEDFTLEGDTEEGKFTTFENGQSISWAYLQVTTTEKIPR